MMDIKADLLQSSIIFLIKKTSGSGIKNKNISDQHPLDLAMHKLAEELHKPILKNFKSEKYTHHLQTIFGVLMQLIRKLNKGIRLLLCVIDIFCKCPWVIPLKHKKGIAVTNAFQKIVDESNRKPKKVWVDKVSGFYNRSMKSWLQDNNIEMYSIRNKG